MTNLATLTVSAHSLDGMPQSKEWLFIRELTGSHLATYKAVAKAVVDVETSNASARQQQSYSWSQAGKVCTRYGNPLLSKEFVDRLISYDQDKIIPYLHNTDVVPYLDGVDAYGN